MTLVKINHIVVEDLVFVIDCLVFSKTFDFTNVLPVCAGTARRYSKCAKWIAV